MSYEPDDRLLRYHCDGCGYFWVFATIINGENRCLRCGHQLADLYPEPNRPAATDAATAQAESGTK